MRTELGDNLISALTIGVVIGDERLREAVAACLRTLHARIAFDISDPARDGHAVRGLRADVLILDFGLPSAHAVMAALRDLEPRPAVIAAHASAEPDIILGALRSGAREFVHPPLDPALVRKALEAIDAERQAEAERTRRAKTAGLLSATGGCGGTTIAAHLAAELRRLNPGADVLAADFDLSAGMLAFWLRATNPYSLLDAANHLDRLDQSYWKALVSAVQPHLDVIAAPAEILLDRMPDGARLRDVLRFTLGCYDWAVVDLGPGLASSAAMLLPELDFVFLVTTPDVSALFQTRRVARKIADLGTPRERVRLVLNHTRKGHDFGAQELEKLVGLPVDAVIPPSANDLDEAQAAGRLASAGCEFSRRVGQLAAKITGRKPEERHSRFSLFRQVRAQEA